MAPISRKARAPRSWRTAVLMFVACVLVPVMLASGCGWGEQPAPQEAPKRVVIATLLSHPSLDEISVALRTRMSELGWEEGQNITYVDRNANGNPQLAGTIAADIQQMQPDAVVPITTPMAQAVANVVTVPIVFAAVTDPVGAGLVPSLDETRSGVTGVADAWPYEQQLALLQEIAPQARRVGVLFNPSDAASDYGMRHIRRIAASKNLTLVEVACTTPAEVGTAATSVINRVDALYLSSDATVISGFAGAARVAFRARKPLMVGDRGTVEKGGLATVSVGYSSVGRMTADLLDKMLHGERDLKVIVAEGDEVFVNAAAAERSGVALPDSVLSRAKEIFKTIE
jgi:putative tryptophan/tyrosine transport system substrate-binding protein